MPVLKYRDPTTQAWVELSLNGAPGAMGPTGGIGPAGPSVVSADANNSAVVGTDGLIYVPTPEAGLTQGQADGLYLKLTGGTMAGVLTVNTFTSSTHAVNKGYVDTQVATVPKVTVSSSAPSTPKVGDIWCAP
jgi:hypothetical protein